MGAVVSHVRCYLAEWYRPEVTEALLDVTVARLAACAAAMCAQGSAVELCMALAVPGDDVLFGVFVAGSEVVVARVCRDAGIPAQRLSAASMPALGLGRRETPDSAATAAPIASVAKHTAGRVKGTRDAAGHD